MRCNIRMHTRKNTNNMLYLLNRLTDRIGRFVGRKEASLMLEGSFLL